MTATLHALGERRAERTRTHARDDPDGIAADIEDQERNPQKRGIICR